MPEITVLVQGIETAMPHSFLPGTMPCRKSWRLCKALSEACSGSSPMCGVRPRPHEQMRRLLVVRHAAAPLGLLLHHFAHDAGGEGDMPFLSFLFYVF